MKIAVLSDTHGLLRPEVKKIISECDAVLHAGDINSQKIIDEMKAAAEPEAPFYIVRGNNDKEWAEKLPHHEEFTIAGVNFYMVHNKKDISADGGPADHCVRTFPQISGRDSGGTAVAQSGKLREAEI